MKKQNHLFTRLAKALRGGDKLRQSKSNAPIMFESLEERQMMSTTVYSVNIVGVSTPVRPPPLSVAMLGIDLTGL